MGSSCSTSDNSVCQTSLESKSKHRLWNLDNFYGRIIVVRRVVCHVTYVRIQEQLCMIYVEYYKIVIERSELI